YYNDGTTGSPNWVKLSTYAGATLGDIISPNPAITITGGTNAVQGAGVSINIANNSAASAGLVAPSGAMPNLVWRTDASGNPIWGSNDDADANPTNEIQSLSVSGGNLSISGGNSVALTSLDAQDLSLSGNTL
ncbi:hypothetical protein, partial [Erwinia amylovora]|uniref:hypothetical protein n=1 Tax=Erwinia amylovora TaxID=552 RepID=UPI0015D4BEDD